jgi:hypothetical protein
MDVIFVAIMAFKVMTESQECFKSKNGLICAQ